MSKLQNKFLVDQFGADKGNELYSLLNRAIDKNMEKHISESKKKQKALRKMILPSISLYYLLQKEQNLTRDEAYALIQEFLWEYGAARAKELYGKMARVPFAFALFKKVCKMNAKSGIWKTSIKEDSNQKYAFDIHKCLWHDTCRDYRCPELCRIFCRSDDIMYQGFENKIRFKRSKTLGEGGDCCDFQFVKK